MEKFDVESAIKAGATRDVIEKYMLENNLEPLNPPTLNKDLTKFTQNMPKAPVEGISTGGWAKPVISGGMGILAGLAATPFTTPAGGALIGSGAAALTDTLLNKFLGQPTSYPLSETLGIVPPGQELSGSPIINTLASTAEGTVMNEALGKIIGYPLRKGGNAFINMLKESDVSADPGSFAKLLPFSGEPKLPFLANKAQAVTAAIRDKAVNLFTNRSGLPGTYGAGSVSGDLSEFKPTFAQALEGGHPLIGTIENIFARKQKAAALVESGQVGLSKSEELLKSFTGSQRFNLNDKDVLANRIQMRAEANFNNVTDQMNDVIKRLNKTKPGSAQYTTLSKDLRDLTEIHNLHLASGQKDFAQLIKLDPLDLAMKMGQASKGTPVSQLPQIKFAFAPSPIIDRIVNDPVEIDKILSAGEANLKTSVGNFKALASKNDLRGYKFMSLIRGNYDTANQLLDISSVKNQWDVYKTSGAGKKLFNSQNRADIDQLFESLHKIGIGEQTPGASRYLTLRLGTGAAALGTGIISGLAGGKTTGLGAAGTIVGGAIGLNQLGKLMTNPDTARLMIAMTKGGPLNMSPTIAGRIIGRALRSEPMTIQLRDTKTGKIIDVEGKVDNTGKFKANLPQ